MKRLNINQTDKVVAMLTKKERVKINDGINKIANADISDNIIKEEITEEREVGAWQQGYFIYRDEVVAEIISDMKQIYNTKITIEIETYTLFQ